MNRFMLPAIALAYLLGLSACEKPKEAPKQARRVSTQTVMLTPYAPEIVATGTIQARTSSNLSFRASGRVAERLVDVGAHVEADQVLARLNTEEQKATIDAAKASVDAAEAKLRQVTSAFDRQKALLAQGFTTQKDYGQAEEDFRTAQNTLEGAKAQLGTAQDQFSYTSLRAPAGGIITVRNIEAGQVVQATSAAFTIALDGPRDAVFDINEALFTQNSTETSVRISLVADPAVTAVGTVREISPTVDPSTGAVRVKVGIENSPDALRLGAVVQGVGQAKARDAIVLPWTALASVDGKPAVWTVDAKSGKVSTTPITIAAYRREELIVAGGIAPGDVVVTAGGQMLRPGEVVSYDKDSRS
jgi:membrane fusion protein, multidrug efflux system